METYIDFVIEYKNGKKEITVVNGPGVKCSDFPTDKIIEKLMGENIEITDFAHTDQYYDELVLEDKPIQEETSEHFIKRRDADYSKQKHQIKI